MEDGYIVYEIEEIGIVAILGDFKQKEPERTDEKVPENPHTVPPSTDVKGDYTSNPNPSMGGAYTGDSTHSLFYT